MPLLTIQIDATQVELANKVLTAWRQKGYASTELTVEHVMHAAIAAGLASLSISWMGEAKDAEAKGE